MGGRGAAGAEDAIYDSYAIRQFMGLDFAVEQVPDATALLDFRHLLEKRDRGKRLFESRNEIVDEQGWITLPEQRGPARRWNAGIHR